MRDDSTLRIIMKIRELIQEFVPCEVCGNSDIKNFYFHVLVDKDSQPYVKCCECEEEYYSATAKKILVKAKLSHKAKVELAVNPDNQINVNTLKDEDLLNKETIHPLVRILANM